MGRTRSVRTPRIIVSGITGHVGRELARQLCEAGAEVHGLTRQAVGQPPSFDVPLSLYHLDGCTETVVNVLKKVRPDMVIHLAAMARREHQTTDIIRFIDANILLGTQLLEGMRLAGCHRFITAGSNLQYSESGYYRPLNFYAATKQAFEALLVYFAEAYEFAAVHIALPTLYSENEPGPKLMTDIAASWADGTVLRLQSEDAPIDLVHVEDAAAAFLQAVTLLETNAVAKGTLCRYSVSSGGDVTPGELVALFERLGERNVIVQREGSSPASRRKRPWHGTVVPGWVPQVTLENGVKRILSRRRRG